MLARCEASLPRAAASAPACLPGRQRLGPLCRCGRDTRFCASDRAGVGGQPRDAGGGARHGAGSVDGWLLRLAAAELGIPARAGLLDQSKRALHADGAVVPLTRREFAVMDYLVAREGEVVSRDDLIQDVWGLRIDPGSNVVDAVIASLRRKLGSQA